MFVKPSAHGMVVLQLFTNDVMLRYGRTKIVIVLTPGVSLSFTDEKLLVF